MMCVDGLSISILTNGALCRGAQSIQRLCKQETTREIFLYLKWNRAQSGHQRSNLNFELYISWFVDRISTTKPAGGYWRSPNQYTREHINMCCNRPWHTVEKLNHFEISEYGVLKNQVNHILNFLHSFIYLASWNGLIGNEVFF